MTSKHLLSAFFVALCVLCGESFFSYVYSVVVIPSEARNLPFATATQSCILAFPIRPEERAMLGVTLKRFEDPDEVRVFEKGKFETVKIGGLTIGRAIYQPGWRWSLHVAPIAGMPLCPVEHVGMVVSGRAMAALADGTEIEMRPGNLFYIPPVPHDSWVIGDEPYVSLHFLGAEKYTK
jgi:hypothetical protein